MADFRTFHNAKRVPAKPMQPVIDPAAWSPSDLGPVADWSYRLSDADINELADPIEQDVEGPVWS